MANITYQVSRWDVSCESADPTKVCSVILGVTATDQVSGISAYKDERISVSCQDLSQFEESAEVFVEGVLGSDGWYLELQTRIAAQMTAPVAAPNDRVKPDFGGMTIGDGYQNLPGEGEESSEEEESPAEETTDSGEEEEAEGVAEEATEEATEEAAEGE